MTGFLNGEIITDTRSIGKKWMTKLLRSEDSSRRLVPLIYFGKDRFRI